MGISVVFKISQLHFFSFIRLREIFQNTEFCAHYETVKSDFCFAVMCGLLQKNTLSTGTKRCPNRKKKKKKHCTGMEMDSFQGSELPDTGLHSKVKMG